MKNFGVKRRAKWGSKTRHGKPVEHLVYEFKNVKLEDVKLVDFSDKFNQAKSIFASMIIEGHDERWTPVMKEAIKKFMFES